MALRLHNTLTRRVEEFVPRDSGKAAIYVCGPTVYDNAHVGHMRAALAFDVLRRYLEAKGYEVMHVQNITDVEDKIIAKAREEGVPTEVITGRYGAEYHDAVQTLGILTPHVEPRATQHIPEMIEMIRGLVDRGYAYYAEGDVYFDVTRLSGYGKLSGRVLEELRAGARLEPGEFKRNPADFALWKKAKPGEPAWDSPWGKGRPGWHIECSAMSLKYLGMGFDIHGGGIDLIFPHHENEIAQSEAYMGREPFARYWLHNAMVMVRGEKMSKSLRNYFTVSEALRRFPAEVVRYALIAVHYRKPIDFDVERFEEARKAVERIRAALRAADTVIAQGDSQIGGAHSDALKRAAERASKAYEAAMDDDLNTSGALAAIFDLVTELNRETDLVVKSAAQPTALLPGITEARASLLRMLEILGLIVTTAREDKQVHVRVRELAAKLRSEIADIFPTEPDTTSLLFDDLTLEDVVNFLLKGREQARRRKDFKTADQIRARLSEAGVLVEDLPTGPRWRIAEPNGRSH